MANTRSVTQWWEEVKKMVEVAKTRDAELLDEEKKRDKNVDLSAKKQAELDEINNPEYQKALRIYENMAKDGVTLETFYAYQVSACMAAGDRIIALGKTFDEIKITSGEFAGVSVPVQVIAGPRSFKLATQYRNLQADFVEDKIKAKSTLVSAGLKKQENGYTKFDLAKQKVAALDQAIKAYKLSVEPAAAPVAVAAQEEKSGAGNEGEVKGEIGVEAKEEAALPPEKLHEEKLKQEEPKVQEAPHAAVEEKKELQLTDAEKNQLVLLKEIKAHHALYDKFNSLITKKTKYNEEAEIEVSYKYDEIKDDIRDDAEGKEKWEKLQDRYKGKILYFTSTRTKAENNLLNEICDEERKFRKQEMRRLCENLQRTSDSKINIDADIVTAADITKYIFDIEGAPRARQEEEERRQAEEGEAKRREAKRQADEAEAEKQAETKRQAEEAEAKRQAAERQQAEERKKIDEKSAKIIEVEEIARTTKSSKDDDDMRLFRFYDYVAELLDKNKIEHNIYGYGQPIEVKEVAYPLEEKVDHTRGKKTYNLNDSSIKKEVIEKDMELYQTNTKMTKAQLDFLILLEGMYAATTTSEADKGKIRDCITYMQSSLDPRINFVKNLSQMQTILKEKLKPATRLVFFTAGGPLKDLTNALNSLVKEEVPNKAALTDAELKILEAKNLAETKGRKYGPTR